MPSPWLQIPLDDYEGHMQAPEVRQLALLGEIFRNVLREKRPASVAVLGVAGGNGLEYVDSAITLRVCGIDIHPDYLDATRQRFAALPGLELHCLDLAADLAKDSVDIAPVEVVHAALVFEHAGWDTCLDNALVLSGGFLSVVLQLPSTKSTGVSATAFTSMQALADDFRLIDPGLFCQEVVRRGFVLVGESKHPLPGGKALWHGIFKRVT